MNQKGIKQGQNSLFNLQIPMKKSYIITDIFVVDQQQSSQLIREQKSRINSTMQMRKSAIQGSRVIYPGSNFIAKKLKRIVNSHLKKAFAVMKRYKKQLINLDIINNIKYRFLKCAYFNIQAYAQSHKGNKLQKVISRNKKPHLLFQTLQRVIRRKNSKYFSQILNYVIRRKNIEHFILKLSKMVNNEYKFMYKRFFFRQVHVRGWICNQKLLAIQKIGLIVKSSKRKHKIFAFRSIIERLKHTEFENTNQIKKSASIKLNQSSVQRARALTNEREKLRGMKSQLQTFSADSSKARFEIRRDLNSYRNKIRQEQKKANKRIVQTSNENIILQAQLQQLNKIFTKRKLRMQLIGNQKHVKDIYKSLFNQSENHVGQIKPRLLNKKKLMEWESEIKQLDEFHIYLNQKLRQQIGEYDGLNISNNGWPEQMLTFEENKILKELIQCICFRSLEKHANSQRLFQLA